MSLEKLPQHIAIIMDGNGRWAKSRQLPRSQGHLEGFKRVEEIVDLSQELGIKALTLFAFSTENWKRPKAEVALLMSTVTNVLTNKLRQLHRDNTKVQFLGRREGVPDSVLNAIDKATDYTKENTGLILNIAFNYGGRGEIVDAAKTLAQQVKEGSIDVNDINEEIFSQQLYTNGLPDPDLLIRTSGEQRISNFLLWQCSYTEFYFIDIPWPEFTPEEFKEALDDFQARERRYGHVEARD